MVNTTTQLIEPVRPTNARMQIGTEPFGHHTELPVATGTAVDDFAAFHAGDYAAEGLFRYQSLLPLSKPTAGEQYAFEVDLDRCTGCKACVSACHHLNGLSTGETWRSVGVLIGETNHLPILQHVTTACHHCVSPTCLAGCPTNAYVKDAATGIVRHLDDQCFGCQYCTMTCVYEVPQYNADRGIVRKCDMCHERLAAGEAPACVQGCPSQAIRITVVNHNHVIAKATHDDFLPAAPPAQISYPSTIYRSARNIPSVINNGDTGVAKVQHGHLPLVIMLLLTQLSVGQLTLLVALSALNAIDISTSRLCAISSLICGFLGIISATLHLGRPHLAFRGILGWRHSWLSREAIAFGVYAGLQTGILSVYPYDWADHNHLLVSAMAVCAAVGWMGIFCSMRIYQFTQRTFWIGARTSIKFTATSIILGIACTLAIVGTSSASPDLMINTSIILTLLLIGKVVYEVRCLKPTDSESAVSLAKTRHLLRHQLRRVVRCRYMCVAAAFCGLVAIMQLAASADTVSIIEWLGWGIFLAVTGGELAERWTYFCAVVPHKMPGGLHS